MVDIAYPKVNINVNDASQREIPFQPNISGLHKPFFTIMSDRGPVDEIVSGNADYLSYVFGNGIFDSNSKLFNHSNIFLMEALQNNVAYVVRVASENIKTGNILISARYRAIFDNIQNDDLNGSNVLLNDFNYPVKGRVIEVEWRARSFDGALTNLTDGYFEDRDTVVPETSSTQLTPYTVSAADRISNTSPGDEQKGFSQWMPILGLEADSPGTSGNDYGFSIYPSNENNDNITRDNLERIAFRFIARQKDTNGRFDTRININNDNSTLVSLSDIAIDKTTNTDYSINNRIQSLYQTEVDERTVSNFEVSFKPMPMNIRRLQNIVKTSGFANDINQNWYHEVNLTSDKLYYTAVVDESTSQLYHEYENTNVLNEAVYENVYLGGDKTKTLAPYFNDTKKYISHIFSDYVGESVYQMVNEDGNKLYKRSEEDDHTFYDVVPYGLNNDNEIQYAKAFVDIEGDPTKILKYSDSQYDIDAIMDDLLTLLRGNTLITDGVTLFGNGIAAPTTAQTGNIAAIRGKVTGINLNTFASNDDLYTEILATIEDDVGPSDPTALDAEPTPAQSGHNLTNVARNIVKEIKNGRVRRFLDLFRKDGKININSSTNEDDNKIPAHMETYLLSILETGAGASRFTYLGEYTGASKRLDFIRSFSNRSVLVFEKSIIDDTSYVGANFNAKENLPLTDDLDNERYTNTPDDWNYYYVPKSLLDYKNPYDIFQYDESVSFINDFRESISKNIRVKSQNWTVDSTSGEFTEPSPKYVIFNNVDLYESKTIANNVNKHTIKTTDYDEENFEYSTSSENNNNGINDIDGSGRKKLRLVTCTLDTGEVRIVKYRDVNGQVKVNSDGEYALEQYDTNGNIQLNNSGEPSLIYGKGKIYIQLKQITPNLTESPYSNNDQTDQISLNYPVLSVYKNVEFYNSDGTAHNVPRRKLDRSVRWNGWTSAAPDVTTRTTTDGETFASAVVSLDRSITREREYLRVSYDSNNKALYTTQERTRKTTSTETTIQRTLSNGRKETVKLSPVEVSQSDAAYDPYDATSNPNGKRYDSTPEVRPVIPKGHTTELADVDADKLDVFNALTPKGQSRYTYTRTKFISDTDDKYTPTSLFNNNKNITLKGGRLNTDLTLDEENEKENYFAEYEELSKDYFINNNNILQKQRVPITHLYDSGYTDATKQAQIGMISRRDDIKVELVTQIVHNFKYNGSTPVTYLGPNKPNTMSQDIQVSASLAERVRLNPESNLYSTGACRASIWGQAGKLTNALLTSWKAPVPVGLARMKFRSEYDGSYRVTGVPVGVPNSRIDGFETIAWTPPALSIIERELTKSSLNIVDFYDNRDMHYRDYRTVYTEGNSVLLDDIVVDRIIYVMKIARRVFFRSMVGARGRSSDIYQRTSDVFSREISRAFDTELEANLTFSQTEVEAAFGDRHTLDLELKFPQPVRVLNISIHADRLEG